MSVQDHVDGSAVRSAPSAMYTLADSGVDGNVTALVGEAPPNDPRGSADQSSSTHSSQRVATRLTGHSSQQIQHTNDVVVAANVVRTRTNFEIGMMGRSAGVHWYEYDRFGGDEAARNCTSNTRVAVVLPSTVAVYPVLAVPRVSSDAGAFGSSGWTPAATWAVTVAATSVCSSSISPAVAVSALNPHARSWISRVDGVDNCRRVFAPFATATLACAAVVGIGPFQVLYLCIALPQIPSTVCTSPPLMRMYLRSTRHSSSRPLPAGGASNETVTAVVPPPVSEFAASPGVRTRSPPCTTARRGAPTGPGTVPPDAKPSTPSARS